MPRVMIKCPKTQEPVPTGIEMDQKSFADPTHCQGTHTWSKKDAYLEPPPPTKP